jgi:hypothetical protein
MDQVTLVDILTMAENVRGYIDRIFVHWTAGHYGQFFDDYHINIDEDGSIHVSTRNFAEKKAHTYHQNSGSIGIALACAYNADTDDLGPEPPTEAQLTSLAEVIVRLCEGLDIPIDYAHVRTHGEQADEDDYGPASTCERWDLWRLRDGEDNGTGGEKMRKMAQEALTCFVTSAEV